MHSVCYLMPLAAGCQAQTDNLKPKFKLTQTDKLTWTMTRKFHIMMYGIIEIYGIIDDIIL